MKAHRTLLTAFRAIRRNPLRSLLTTFGIVIGVGAVIAMMEIGNGSSTAIAKSFESMGANTIVVMPGSAMSAGISQGTGSSMKLTPGDCEAIIKECPAVAAAAPVVRGRAQIIYGGRNWVPTYIYGSTPDYLKVREWSDLEEGDCFSDKDVMNSNKVCIVGKTIAKELFQGESPVGKEIRVKNVIFKVLGVLKKKGANMMGMDQDDVLLVPWTTLKYRVSGGKLSTSSASSSDSSSSSINSLNDLYPDATAIYPAKSTLQTTDTLLFVHFANVDEISVAARSQEDVSEAITEITGVLREKHRLKAGAPDDFSIRNMAEMIRTMSATTNLMKNLLLCVAMISLFVGGVGIMNIMLVSVTERTREIGLRMAVGARAADILRQFLTEAVTLCMVGGALGIALGHGSSFLVSYFLNWPVESSPGAIVAAILVSSGVGVVFGFYPAWKASKLDPIEALRYE